MSIPVLSTESSFKRVYVDSNGVGVQIPSGRYLVIYRPRDPSAFTTRAILTRSKTTADAAVNTYGDFAGVELAVWEWVHVDVQVSGLYYVKDTADEGTLTMQYVGECGKR